MKFHLCLLLEVRYDVSSENLMWTSTTRPRQGSPLEYACIFWQHPHLVVLTEPWSLPSRTQGSQICSSDWDAGRGTAARSRRVSCSQVWCYWSMPSSHPFGPNMLVACWLETQCSARGNTAEGWEPCRRQRPAEDWPGPSAASLGHIEAPRFLPTLGSRTLASG